MFEDKEEDEQLFARHHSEVEEEEEDKDESDDEDNEVEWTIRLEYKQVYSRQK